jgi:hypothetical protein
VLVIAACASSIVDDDQSALLANEIRLAPMLADNSDQILTENRISWQLVSADIVHQINEVEDAIDRGSIAFPVCSARFMLVIGTALNCSNHRGVLRTRELTELVQMQAHT